MQVTIRGDAATLRKAADLLTKQALPPGARAFVIPAGNEDYSTAIDSGAIKALVGAGFVICSPATPEPAVAEGESAVTHPPQPLEAVIEAIRGGRQ